MSAIDPERTSAGFIQPISVPWAADKMRSLAPGMRMKRRDFIAGLIFVASSRAAPAQQLRRRIGVVSPAAPIADLTEDTKNSDVYPGFFQELRRLGYIEGQNLIVERRSAEGVPIVTMRS